VVQGEQDRERKSGGEMTGEKGNLKKGQLHIQMKTRRTRIRFPRLDRRSIQKGANINQGIESRHQPGRLERKASTRTEADVAQFSIKGHNSAWNSRIEGEPT